MNDVHVSSVSYKASKVKEKKIYLHIPVTRDLYDKLQQIANTEERTVTGQARLLLREKIEEFEKPPRPQNR